MTTTGGRPRRRARPGPIVRTCLLTMAIGLTGCGGSSAPAPGPIVFSGQPDDADVDANVWQLLVMNRDGTGVRRMTQADGDRDLDPSWSPDGTQVVFERGTDKGCDFTGCEQIWIVDADGTDERRLTPTWAASEDPDWSPDGDRIVFHQWNPTDAIYVMNVDGSDVRKLTDGEYPAWSPDGSRIVFSREEVDGERDIYVMNADGTDVRRLTHTAEPEFSPAWSPDGEKIAFERRGHPWTIVVVNDDGSEERTLFPPDVRLSCGSQPDSEARPPGCADNGEPAWSPDGSQIAFIRDELIASYEIWVMDADGDNAHEVQAGPYRQRCCPDWAALSD